MYGINAGSSLPKWRWPKQKKQENVDRGAARSP